MIRFLPAAFRGRAQVCRAGFTLIELLTVIVIILVLAGLLLGIAGNANYKSSFARATTEIQAISTALESYKADNGSYPRPATVNTGSDKLNAQLAADKDPGGSDKGNFQLAGQLLYQMLSGITFTGSTPSYGKTYMTFTPGQLSSGNSAFTAANLPYIIDPFSLAYGYSTANLYAQDTGGDLSAAGYNPTFDLWSTGGYGTGGKAYPTTGAAVTNYPTLWAKNW